MTRSYTCWGALSAGLVAAVVSAFFGTGWAQQTAPASEGWAEIDVPTARPDTTPEVLAEGKKIYRLRCSPCHGVKGDGNGPVAQFLDPKPRDFTFANYKFRTTAFSELTRDDDLYRTITRGIPGSAMPSWVSLPAEDRWKVIYYIKTFAEDFFSDPLFDPYRVGEEGETYLIDAPEMPPASDELIEYGKAVFERVGCRECHGQEGRGDGPSAGKQFTYRKHRVVPRDLTKGWTYKGGTGVEDIWRTLTGGLNGTPMPSFIGQLDTLNAEKDENDRIAVAHYVRSLVDEEGASRETVLRVRKVRGDIPLDPNDEIWESAREIHFRLFGQVTRRPRWQTPSIDHVRVRAVYNDSVIAIRLEYDDRTRSMEHASPDILTENTNYPVVDVLDYEHNRVRFRDAVAVQFSVKPHQWADRPYFLYGQMDDPVNLWRYRADTDVVPDTLAGAAVDSLASTALDSAGVANVDVLMDSPPDSAAAVLVEENADAPLDSTAIAAVGAAMTTRLDSTAIALVDTMPYNLGTFEELTAKGPDKIAVQPEDDQALTGGARHWNGRWRVVLVRPLTTPAERSDVQIEPGQYIPFSVMAWDGAAGESGLRQSLSSWYNMILDAPTPPQAYRAGGGVFLLVVISELMLLRKSRSRRG